MAATSQLKINNDDVTSQKLKKGCNVVLIYVKGISRTSKVTITLSVTGVNFARVLRVGRQLQHTESSRLTWRTLLADFVVVHSEIRQAKWFNTAKTMNGISSKLTFKTDISKTRLLCRCY